MRPRYAQPYAPYWPWLFIAPCMLGLLVFTYLPTLASFSLSFHYWNLLGEPSWVGIDNYKAIVEDPRFWRVALNSLGFMMGCTVLEVTLGLCIALGLNGATRGFQWLRAMYFLPYITPMVSIALVWGWIFDPQQGALNHSLWALHLMDPQSPIPWLYQPQTAMGSVMTVEVWKMVGYNTLLFLAGLQGVPSELYESSTIDGANRWQTFWRVTLPMLTPTLFFVLIITMIHTLQAFDVVYLLTQGGPENSTSLIVYWLFKNAFEFYRIGPASAMAYMLFLVVALLTLIQWQLRKRWVMFEEETP